MLKSKEHAVEQEKKDGVAARDVDEIADWLTSWGMRPRSALLASSAIAIYNVTMA